MSDRPERTLPELDAARIGEIESALFAAIAAERTSHRVGTRRRRLRLGIGLAAAAAVAVVLAFAVPLAVNGFGAASSGAAIGIVPNPAAPGPRSGADSQSAGAGSTSGRAVVATASATVQVKDVTAAVRAITAAAQAHQGYVQSMSIGGGTPTPVPLGGTTQGVVPGSGTTGDANPADAGSITVRVPSAQLAAVIAQLDAIGEVQASGINRDDVTDQQSVLQGQVAADQASVARLTELMAKAGSVADLLTTEQALTTQQAALQAAQQQLAALQDQVSMSTLSVTVTPRPAAAAANPVGFWDGLVSGWNGLVAALNGIVVAVGFALPWLAVLAVAAAIVWGALRVSRVRRVRAARHVGPQSPGERPGA